MKIFEDITAIFAIALMIAFSLYIVNALIIANI